MEAYAVGQIIGICIAGIVGLILGIKILIKGNRMNQTGIGVLGLFVIFLFSFFGLIVGIPLYFLFDKCVLNEYRRPKGTYTPYQNNMNRQNYMQGNNNMQYQNNMMQNNMQYQNNMQVNNIQANNNSDQFRYYE